VTRSFAALLTVLASSTFLLPPSADAQQKFVVKPIAEKKLKTLPAGPWYWRIENFPSLAEAQAAIGTGRWNPNTVSYDAVPALAAEAAGKTWLFTLGPKGGSTPGGTKVADIGPVPPINASEYLLRINHTGGVPGVKTPVHSHPGSETFYVVSGRLSQKTASGVHHAEAGEYMLGQGADMAMEVSSSGATELHALVMFVVDASRPFSTPAKLPAGH
jgi:quercetin dioxygenase-like cupin family protein